MSERNDGRLLKIVMRMFVALFGLLFVLLVAVKWFYGRGSEYAGVTTAPLLPESALETLVSLDYPPGNVSASPDGRIFFCLHPFAQAARFQVPTVYELVDGKPQPYPSAEYQRNFQGVFGMTIDRQNRLWAIEPAGLDHERTKLTAFDLQTGKPTFEYVFPKGEAQFAQDLRVTADGKTIVLADTGLFKFTSPAIIVFDTQKKTFRKVLMKHESTQPKDFVIRTPFGPHKLGYGLVSFVVGVDGIEISADQAWFYYAAMTHDTLYRVPLSALLDEKLDEAALVSRIEALGRKPLSDGITIDAQNRIIITDIENGGLARREADGSVKTLVKSGKVIWADGVVATTDGSLLFTDSAIPAYIDQLARPPTVERLAAARPYRIYRVKP
jgi:sugar lactone lactonase YvrE